MCLHCYRRGHTAGNQKPAATNVGSGDIIVVNSSSYIDIIYLAFRYVHTPTCCYPAFITFTIVTIRIKSFSPVFTQIDTTKNGVRFISAQDAIKQCGNYPQTSVNGKTCSLKDASRLAKEQGLGPIVVFPEVRRVMFSFEVTLSWLTRLCREHHPTAGLFSSLYPYSKNLHCQKNKLDFMSWL